MREMKDSGIEWIGEIPINWKICRLKDYAHICNGRDYSEVLDEIGNYPVIGSGGQFAKACKSLYQKESVLLGRKGTIDKPLFVNYPFWTVDTMYYTEIKENVSAKYFYYLCTQINFDFYQYGSAVPSMTQRDLYNVNFPYPALDEQCRIANYLDRKCSQIDFIIARQQEVIEKLKVYKLSVITEAVTKGLNPDVPMKDSGVEWIGEIPEHWTVSALRYGLENIQTGPFGSQLHAEDYIEDGIFVINPANIVEGCIVPDNRCSVTELKAQELSRHILNKGDIIFARRGEMGRCAYFGGSFQQYLCGTGCIKIQCNANLMPEFISWFLQTSCVKQYLTLNSVGTTMANLNTTIISGIPVVFPPISEQEKVVEYIKNKICEIDCVLKNKLSIVEKLTKYKKSLIYEVVTGKKEV